MRLIPGKTKVQIELFKGVSIWDLVIAGVAGAMLILVALSSVPAKYPVCLIIFSIAALLLIRLDAEPNYVVILHMLRHFAYVRRYARVYDDEMLEKKGKGEIKDDFIEQYKEKNESGENVLSGDDDLIWDSIVDHVETQAEMEKERIRTVDMDPDGKAGGKRKKKRAGDKKDPADAADKRSEKELIKQENRILKSKIATEEEKNAVWLARAQRSAEKKKAKKEARNEREENANYDFMENIIPFTGVKDNLIEYGGKYYGSVIEIDPVEFRFFSEHRRNNSIESGVGRVLRGIHSGFAANIVKLERPIIYDRYLKKEEKKLAQIRKSFESGMMNEEEFQARVEIENDRLAELKGLCSDKQVVASFYYIVLFESDKKQLELQTKAAIDSLEKGEMTVRRLGTKELAVFLKYTNQIDFDERDIDKYKQDDYAQWAMPQKVAVKYRTVEVNDIVTHNFRVVNYPSWVGDAWLAGVLSLPATKVVVKCAPMERGKAIRTIDRSLQELRGQYNATGVDSRRIELEGHIDTLSNLLVTLQGEGEELLQCNIYVTAYDTQLTRINKALEEWPSLFPEISNLKKTVRRTWQESNFRLNGMDFNQMNAFIGSQISAYDPEAKQGRGIPSNSVAAGYPWIYAHISDEGGVKLGSSDGVPVFIDFFRRDSERVNSNMVIIGKSGSGKSYATKSILANLASEDAKIFILDPENEYSELAQNLHGKVINVANAQYGRLNPFHIITALDDDEEGGNAAGSFATHLQFLEEFYRQILPDIEKDALEYLNNLTERLYTNRGITPESDLSRLRPEDYPVFDDLYDAVLEEFERTDNEYIRSMLRTLVNYVAKFATGGRNSNIWNGPSTVTTDENFTVFNFQAMLANRNTTIANAQMLLVLKYIDNEIIKNRDYNTKYGLNRKVVVVIDEAHVFIDAKFPVALDFMFQLAKRIRKYNGMQIVITQNIKDFVGSDEIARKSTAIINACQYSFIFALAPNDMHDLCKLYEKAGGINENEQEQIIQAPRGQAFTIMSANSRSTFRVEVPANMVDMFQDKDFQSFYYTGTEGAAAWDEFVGESRALNRENTRSNRKTVIIPIENAEKQKKRRVNFQEISLEEAERLAAQETAVRETKEETAEETTEQQKITKASAISDMRRPDMLERLADLDEDNDFGLSDEEMDALIESRRAQKKSQKSVHTQAFRSVPPMPSMVPLVDYVALMDNIRQQVLAEVMGELKGELKDELKDKYAVQAVADQQTEQDHDEENLEETVLRPLELEDEDEDEDILTLEEPDFGEIDLDDEMDEDQDDSFLDALFGEDDEDEDEDIYEDADETGEADEEDEEDEEDDEDFDVEIDIEPEMEDDTEESDEEDEEDDDEDFDFSSLFELEDEEDEDEEDDDDTFDIMELLRSEAEKEPVDKKAEKTGTLEDISELVAPGEVVDVTLEELGEVVAILRKRKKASNIKSVKASEGVENGQKQEK